MPGKVKVKVLAGRNLPVMDKGSDTTDAYVEIKLGNVTHKTDICRKSLNPQWNSSEWYRFEVDDAELQDEPLQLRLMDHDTYSANDAIGKVYISLNPLLLPEAQQHPPNAVPPITHSGKGAVMSGWIPVFDTMHGIRGEVNVIVKVELFNDFNKFRQSSCGVQFFHSPIIPHGYQAQVIHGFVEELVINDDPEYQWIDKIRTPRASNEARQVAFLKLSGQVQRKIGLKALELGANAVVGFRRCLDLEGDVGVVARGIGTAVTLVRTHEPLPPTHLTHGNQAVSPDALAQQLRKYIDFLNTDHQNTDHNSVTNLSNEQVATILNVLSPNVNDVGLRDNLGLLKHSSSLSSDLFTSRSTEQWQHNKLLSEQSASQGTSSQSLREDVLSSSPLKLLLEQEDSRQGGIYKNALTRSLKHIKHSPGILSKKMSGLNKSKKPQEDDENADKVSMKSYTSEKSLRFQFSDFKSELKKKTRFKKSPSIKRSISSNDGGGEMAALLVRSVMQTHSSLDCIKESQEKDSPISTLRRSAKTSVSENPPEHSVPNLAIVIEVVPVQSTVAQPEPTDDFPKLKAFSLDKMNASSDTSIDKAGKLLSVRKNKRGDPHSCPSTPQGLGTSDSFLKLPSEDNLYGSGSSDDYSTSDEEDNSEELSDHIRGSTNFETVSLIVKSVLENKKDNHNSDHLNENIEGTLSAEVMESVSTPDLFRKQARQSAHDYYENMEGNPEAMESVSSTNIFKLQGATGKLSQDYYGSISDSNISSSLENFRLAHLEGEDITLNEYDGDFSISQSEDESTEKDDIDKILSSQKVDEDNILRPLHTGFGNSSIFQDSLSAGVIDQKSPLQEHTMNHPVTCDVHPKSHNLFDSAFKNVLIERLHLKGFHHSQSTSPKSPAISPSGTDCPKKSRFHFPTNPFRRHTSECGTTPGSIFSHKSGLISPKTKKKKLRTFSAGDKDLKPGLITTAIQTMLMEKLNVMGEIINHEPIVGDDKHLRKQSNCSLDITKFLSDDSNFPTSQDKTAVNTFRFNETLVDFSPSLSTTRQHKSLTDISGFEYGFIDTSQKMKDRDVLSLPRETVLGSLFMSINDLKHEEDRRHYLSVSSDFSSQSSIQRSVDKSSHLEDEVHFDNRDAHPDKSTLEDFERHHSEYKTEYHIDEENASYNLPNNLQDTHQEKEAHYTPADRLTDNISPESDRQSNSEDDESKVGGSTLKVNFNLIPEGGHRDPKLAIRKKSDSNELAKFKIPSTRGNSLTAGVSGGAVLRPSMNQESIDMLEYPFLSMTKFPTGFILHIGGAVAARSVKLLERVPNPEEPAPRDTWWSELRTEVRSHMRALRCNAVLAYQETTAICDDVCVLSATGTAAVIDLHPSSLIPHPTNPVPTSLIKPPGPINGKLEENLPGEVAQMSLLDRTEFDKTEQTKPNNIDNNARRRGGGGERCGPCHVPYNSNSMPYRVSVTKCALCKKGRVPSVILCSLEPPEGLTVVGRGCLVQAAITRARTPSRGEPAARDISDQLPFLEYELHRLLLAKLRVRGMNAIFGLRTSIAVGANLVAAVGVGTGVLLAALGSGGGGPKVRAGPGDPQILQALQQSLDEALQTNRNVYQLHTEETGRAPVASDTDESDEDLPDMELSAGNKDTCVLEVDDAEDLEVLRALTEARPPAGLHVVNTQSVPGLLGCEGLVSVRNLQMFTQLWRARLASPPGPLHHHFHRLLQNVYFKLRRMVPCAICDLRFRLDLPEADEIQLVVTGMAVGLGEPPLDSKKMTDTPPILEVTSAESEDKDKEAGAGGLKKSDSNEMIFTLEEEHVTDINGPHKSNPQPSSAQTLPSSVNGSNFLVSGASAWQSGVDMTPLAGVPGARVLRYLGNLDYIFVRESTSVREHGGLSGFLHGFITEVMAVIRAHVTALGGNAIVAFYMTELILSDNPHKNQAQCLVSVGGDVVFVSYFPAD